MTRALFTYGTLTFPAVVRRLARRALPMQPARLAGFARRALRGVGYPGIVPDASSVVSGMLVDGVSPALLARLDRWEGAEYARRLLRVETACGDPLLAHVYTLAPRALPLVLSQDWDAAAFEREQLARWLQLAARFGAREAERGGEGRNREMGQCGSRARVCAARYGSRRCVDRAS